MKPIGQPCVAGIVFAVAVEADAFERHAERHTETRAAGLVIHEGFVAGRRIAWSVGGVGAAAAARATQLLVAGHRPGIIISAGFAGGLDPALQRGALVRPARVVAEDASRLLPLVVPPLHDPAAAPPTTIVTTAAIVVSPAEKRALAARSGAHLVDMETLAVAAVAAEAGLPCAAIRVISDTADEALPPEVVTLARPQSMLRLLGGTIGAVGRRPGAALDLWRLYERAIIDGRTLARALAAVCSGIDEDRTAPS